MSNDLIIYLASGEQNDLVSDESTWSYGQRYHLMNQPGPMGKDIIIVHKFNLRVVMI
jgi:hypothetical protein